jgi:hypothetical protein
MGDGGGFEKTLSSLTFGDIIDMRGFVSSLSFYLAERVRIFLFFT